MPSVKFCPALAACRMPGDIQGYGWGYSWNERTLMPIDVWPVAAAPFIGSFLGVLVCRLPQGEPVVLSRSHCEACGTVLTVRDLVPLASFVALRGRCRYCGEAITLFHPAIELAATGVALSASLAATGLQLWLWCLLGWTLLALAWIDWDWMVLPDALTLPLLLAGFGAALLAGPNRLLPSAIGAVAGWVAFTGIAWIYRRLRNRDGLGGGDAKLLAAAGAWLGPEPLPRVVLLAAVTAAAWTIGMRIWRGQAVADEPIAFGPWIALSIWLVGLTA